jgi:YgiT-type zinc finger domain-containing protein
MKSTKAASRAPLPPCQRCGGECESQLITLTLRCSQYSFAVVRNVPADVCQNCGESLFTVPTAGRLIAALHANHTPDEVALIPIFDFAVAAP